MLQFENKTNFNLSLNIFRHLFMLHKNDKTAVLLQIECFLQFERLRSGKKPQKIWNKEIFFLKTRLKRNGIGNTKR